MKALFPLPGALITAALFGFAASASAQVVVSEIHYHSVEEPAFDSINTYNPVLDLSDDVHEFIEIQNTGRATFNL